VLRVRDDARVVSKGIDNAKDMTRLTVVEEIKDLRTAISDVKFVDPNGVHGGLGSTKAHNELLAIIDTSSDYNIFVRRLNNWVDYR